MKIGEDYHHPSDSVCETRELASIIRLCRDYDILDESGVRRVKSLTGFAVSRINILMVPWML